MPNPSAAEWTPEEVAEINRLAAPTNDAFASLRVRAFEAVSWAHRIITSARSYASQPELPLDRDAIKREVGAKRSVGLKATEKSVRAERKARNRQRRAKFADRERDLRLAQNFLKQLKEMIDDTLLPSPKKGRPRKISPNEKALALVRARANKLPFSDLVDSNKYVDEKSFIKRQKIAAATGSRFSELVYETLRKDHPQGPVDELGSGLFKPAFLNHGSIYQSFENFAGATFPEDIRTFVWAAHNHYSLMLRKVGRTT
jgi:hypothetical protein